MRVVDASRVFQIYPSSQLDSFPESMQKWDVWESAVF